MTRTTLTLVRHGRVGNPNHVVYSDLPGFTLDSVGVLEAHAVGRHLETTKIDAVWSSPLERAVATAAAIARPHGLVVTIDDRATEWRLSSRWIGQRWEDLPVVVPGELDDYLASPADLPFAEQSLAEVAHRMTSLVADLVAHGGHGVLVSHQDTIGATILALTRQPLADLLMDPPPHASATTLQMYDDQWVVTERWAPELG